MGQPVPGSFSFENADPCPSEGDQSIHGRWQIELPVPNAISPPKEGSELLPEMHEDGRREPPEIHRHDLVSGHKASRSIMVSRTPAVTLPGNSLQFDDPQSVVAWIGAEMEFALSQAVASGDTFEHRPSECGHCVQDFLTDLDLRDLPGKAAGFELGADDTLPTADLRFYPAALVVPCGHMPGHAAVAADLGNMAIPNRRIPRRLRADHCVIMHLTQHA